MKDPFKSTDMSNKSITFSEPEPEGPKKSPRRSSKANRRRSSFMQRIALSFRRSGGERGADVETLRGVSGADFEGYATITRGEGGGCCSGGSDNSEKLILMKGPHVFVFKNEEEKAPKYAVDLAHTKATKKGLSHGSYVVTLETNLGDVEYVMNFKEETIADQFVEAATEQAKIGETEEIRKRLGHEDLMARSKSVKYASTVAKDKIKNQPEKQEKLTVDDMAAINPVVGI
jgi:hypothetical protein